MGRVAFLVLVSGLSVFWASPVYARSLNANLINGTPVAAGQYSEVVSITSAGMACTATIVGPRTIITAASCVTSGATAAFSVGTTNYTATMTRSTVYPTSDHDIALGITNTDITGVTPATITGTATTGLSVTLLGYGCTTAGGGTSDGKLRVGTSVITGFSDDDMITEQSGGAAICFGDFGGPAFIINNGVHELVGVSSKGNIQDTNYSTRTDITDSQTMFTTFASANNAQICGVNLNCNTPPPPPAATCSMSASPNTIALGAATTVTLTSQNATTAAINGTSVNVPTGSESVTPTTTGTVTINGTVTGTGGNGTCSTTVSVTTPPPPATPTCTLTATPDSVQLGSSITLTLTTQGQVTTANIDGTSITPPSGTKTVTPTAAGTFISNGTAVGPGGTGVCSVTYYVTTTPPPPPTTPNFAITQTYCGANTLSTTVSQVCLAIIAHDTTITALQMTSVITVAYSDGSSEVIPIIDSETEAPQTGDERIIQDLTYYANGLATNGSYTVLDTRTGQLVSLPPSSGTGSPVPSSLSGRSIKGEAFMVTTLSPPSSQNPIVR